MMKSAERVTTRALYGHEQARDSCGFGLIARLRGEPDHGLLQSAIGALSNMQHRGGLNADGATGDGCGLLMQMPDAFMREAARRDGVELGDRYGVGVLFLSQDESRAAAARRAVEAECAAAGLQVLGWRPVPRRVEVCGDLGLLSLPCMEQLFFSVGSYSEMELASQLFCIRLRLEKTLAADADFYINSLSERVLLYKGLVMPDVLADFYPDLQDPLMATAICVFHVRYSTNTLPAWKLAQPFRLLAHNGEINTIIGNRNWAEARTGHFRSPLLPDLAGLGQLVNREGSDSSSLDNMLEVLTAGGMPPYHALRLLVPPAWENDSLMSEELRSFYRYNALHMEPWDGPAGIVMTDGRYAVCALDRNGLRPARYYLTDDVLIAASEVGVMDCEVSEIAAKGRVKPGGILVVDTVAGEVLYTSDVADRLMRAEPYEAWLRQHSRRLSPASEPVLEPLSAEQRQAFRKQFLLTAEDREQVLLPLATDGVEGTGSMGDDTPIVPLSRTIRPLYDMFRQQFAQVTNPPIDSLRESAVMSLLTTLGRERNILSPKEDYALGLELPSPVLSGAAYHQLLMEQDEFAPTVLDCCYDPAEQGLEQALCALCDAAVAAVRSGAVVLVLSDRELSRGRLPIHSLLAVGAVHRRLVGEGLRCDCNIVVASGTAHNTHHLATLFGFGATAVYPWLGLDTVAQMASELPESPEQLLDNCHRGLEKGLLKIFSKMGISTISAYRGAALFDVVGLDTEVIDRCFVGVDSRIGGLDFADLEQDCKALAATAWQPLSPIPRGGVLKYIHGTEFHAFNPDVVQSLHRAVRSGESADYRDYAVLSNERSPAMLRDLLKLVPQQPIELADVEPREAILKRFDTAGMSLGALSPEAHETLAVAMNRLGGHSNSGEGGEAPARYRDERCSAIKQVASGRFGVTPHYLVNADILQIKIAQGAKPGEGGQLPGDKVNELIASLRCSVPGVGLISPPPHHDIYSIEDLAQLIYDLKEVNDRALVSVKLVSESGVGTIAAGVAKAGADLITISGHDGGTGASPLSSIRYAGCPWELGLSEAHQALRANGLRDRVILQVDGGFKTGLDVIKGAILGADSFGFGTGPMVAMGCKYLRICHLNNCATGIATQQKNLRSQHFVGNVEAVMNFFQFVADETREYLSQLGVSRLVELIGRYDLLRVEAEGRAAKLRFDSILHAGPAAADVPHYGEGRRSQVRGVRDLAERLHADFAASIAAGEAGQGEYRIRNVHRAIGAGLSGEIARHHGAVGLTETPLELDFHGTAGQSFGAWNAPGLRLRLVGDANDYVGKGMSGGRIVLRPPEAARYTASAAPIMGNTCLYGATGGELYAAGRAGERFGVRNSGAHAVVEGVGNHGCEYMTGGAVAILGRCGGNFAAGMTNGIAFVLDENGNFPQYCNTGLVQLLPLESDELLGYRELLLALLSAHATHTDSRVAKQLLDSIADLQQRFTVVVPQREQSFLYNLLRKELGRRGELRYAAVATADDSDPAAARSA